MADTPELTPEQAEPVLTKTLRDGRVATVYRTPDGWDVHVDGKPFTTGQLHRRVFPGEPTPIDAIGGTPVVGFTEQEATALHAVLTAERDAWKRSPRGQRATLVADADALDGRCMAARERAANTGEGWQEIVRLEKELNTAWEAIGAFDAANPELAAEIAAEAKAKRDKFAAEAMNRAFTD